MHDPDQAHANAARFRRVQVAGAAEACVDAVSLTGFARLKALSTSYNEQPEKASRCAAGQGEEVGRRQTAWACMHCKRAVAPHVRVHATCAVPCQGGFKDRGNALALGAPCRTRMVVVVVAQSAAARQLSLAPPHHLFPPSTPRHAPTCKQSGNDVHRPRTSNGTASCKVIGRGAQFSACMCCVYAELFHELPRNDTAQAVRPRARRLYDGRGRITCAHTYCVTDVSTAPMLKCAGRLTVGATAL